jgi:hypothetical protein
MEHMKQVRGMKLFLLVLYLISGVLLVLYLFTQNLLTEFFGFMALMIANTINLVPLIKTRKSCEPWQKR